MEQIEAKSRTKLLIDNTEFPVQVKIPYDENLLTQEDQPRSIYLSAMSNELGLFIYAVGQRLMVINQEGLLSQFKATKDAGDSGQLDRPTLESMKSKGQLVTVALNKDLVKNEPITRILLEEEYTGKCGRLAIGFKSKVIIIETSSILSGNVDVVTSFDLPGKESLQTFSFVEKNMIAIDTAGKVHLVSGELKISGLEGLKIADCCFKTISAKAQPYSSLAILLKNQIRVALFKVTANSLTKLKEFDLPKTRLELFPLNVHQLTNGCVLVSGYQYEIDNEIYSYAIVSAESDDFSDQTSKVAFREQPDVIPLGTSDYPERMEDAEFKLVDYPGQ